MHRTFALLLQSAITFHGCKVSYKQSRAFRDRGRAANGARLSKTQLNSFLLDCQALFSKKIFDFLTELN